MTQRSVVCLVLLLSFRAIPNAVSVADAADAEPALVIELYRGIVRIEPHAGPDISFSASVVDFNAYVESGLARPTGGMVVSPSAKLDVLQDSVSVRIRSPGQRELVELVVKAPPNTACRVKVAHYGEVHVFGINADLDINVFQGLVRLDGVRQAVSVEVIRNGNVTIDCAQPQIKPIVASTYDGRIRVLLPAAARINLDARSYSGVVRGEAGRLRDDGVSAFVFRSVLGDIEIIRKSD